MMIRHLAAVAAAALVLTALVPSSVASAADSTLTGTLSGSAGPEEGLVIGWVDADDFARFATTTSGASGDYSLAIPDDLDDYLLFTNLTPTGTGVGQAIDPGYTGEFYGDDGDRDFLSSRVDPYTAPASGPLDITLTPSGGVSGSAELYAGRSLVLRTLGGTEVDQVTVGNGGEYAFDALYPGHYRITAFRPGYTNYVSPVVAVSPGDDTDVDVMPQPSAAITGTVRNGSTRLKGITVEAFSVLDSDFAVDAVQTTSTGTYSFVDLQPGDYRLVFTSYPKSASKSYQPETVLVSDVESGESRTVNERLAAAGYITGKVKKTTGADYYFARVYTSSNRFVGSTYVDSTLERFRIGGMPAGKYTVHFSDSVGKRYDTASVTVTTHRTTDVGTRTLTRTTATLSGSVTGATGGYVTVSLGGSGLKQASIGSSGKYRITGLVRGITYTVSAIARDTEKRTIQLKVPASRTKTLTPGAPFGTYSGRALVNGTPVQGYGGYTTYKSGYSPFTFENGEFRGTGRAGPATLLNFFPVAVPLPERSPYWYTAPAEVQTITLVSGATTALGSFELDLNGVPAAASR